eukprot:TRINITY_DN10737_c0_g2_i1.p1 TRINITY_DN10737_c0_g2~~TRINITY_DN10737_c0_g2_i1.p1  ORF type:complete len:262 (+),score=52.49 TRINITY_DN10737_c0_g2_i1:513-1298(+)
MHGPQMVMPYVQSVVPRIMYTQEGIPVLVQVPVMVPMMGMPVVSSAASDVSSQEEGPVVLPVADDEGSRNLIVNGLAAWMDVDWMENVFRYYGELESTHVVCDIATGKSKGYGFVKYANSKAAEAAIQALNGTIPENSSKQLKVSIARQQEAAADKQSVNVYISGFKDHLNQSTLSALCSRYGTVVDCKVLCLKHHSDGVAFVRFSSISEATRCCQALNQSQLSFPSAAPITFVARYADKLGKSRQTKSESDLPKLLRKSL